jgi:formylglycine-generating enzyme required for sulfatase activity
MLRAGFWYGQAEPRLAAGLTRVKIQRRLADIAKLDQPTPAAKVHPASHDATGAKQRPPLAVAPFDEKQAKAHQLRWSKYLKVPVEMTNPIGLKLVLIPPGEFAMGSTKEEVNNLRQEAMQQKAPNEFFRAIPGEAPQHRVRITRPFYLGMCEVTQAEYERVMGDKPSSFKDAPDHPVERIAWHEATEFCRRLGDLTAEKEAQAVYRLPTEAEWEYACRAGIAARYFFGDGPALIDANAWWWKNGQGHTQPVGRLRPNAWGLFDMAGNVWEWCSDWYAADYYANSPLDDPPGPTTGASHTIRGCSWYWGYAPQFRCAYRDAGAEGRFGDYGFRLVRIVSR